MWRVDPTVKVAFPFNDVVIDRTGHEAAGECVGGPRVQVEAPVLVLGVKNREELIRDGEVILGAQYGLVLEKIDGSGDGRGGIVECRALAESA